MNEIWKVLGIAPTSDKKAIRSAYSAQSKRCHPEENPEEFKRLHEAYQAAMAYAAGNAKGAGRRSENVSGFGILDERKKNLVGEAEKFQGKDGDESDKFQRKSEDESSKFQEKDEDESDKSLKRNEDEQEQATKKNENSQDEDVTEKEMEMGQSSEMLVAETDQDLQNNNKENTESDSEFSESSEPEPTQPSLLSLLEQAEEQQFEKSMTSGALKQFSAILNDPKKFRKADAWKAFFMSEEFLQEQYSESFANGMLRILQGFRTPDNFCISQMPSGFLVELAIAYALVLNAEQENKKETAESFYAREIAASIWNMQQGEFGTPVRLLFKPENQVRMRSFADYIRLKNFNSRGLLTRQNQDVWQEMVRGGQSNYLYELKGRGMHDIYPGSRSVNSLELYVFWLRTETVPKCVLEYMYKEYGLRGVEHTSTRKLYEPLKKEIIKQYPDIEDALYGEEGRAKLVSAWYRDLMQIISDSERLYSETEEIKERVRVLFAREEWEKICFLPELFEKMYLQLHDRSVMPASIAMRLYEFYSREKGNAAWDAEQGEIMVEGMVHSLYYGRKILDMHEQVPDATPYFQEGNLCEVRKGAVGVNVVSGAGAVDVVKTTDADNGANAVDVVKTVNVTSSANIADTTNVEGIVTKVEIADAASDREIAGAKDVCTDFGKGYPMVLANQDFWHYFLMRGFGCWSVLMGGGSRYRRGYTTGMLYSLPSYIKYLYQPSKRWQKLFIGGYGKDGVPVPEFCSYFEDENGNFVPGVEFILADGRNLRAEFYLHYVRYFLDGEEIFLPVYRFAECMELAKSMERAEQFFILLAITEISEEDYKQAVEVIEAWLSRLPLAPVSIPVIAGLLAGRNEGIREDIAQTDAEEHPGSGMDKMGKPERGKKSREDSLGMRRNRGNQRAGKFLGQKNKSAKADIFGIYYMEEDELCFRAVVKGNGFDVFRLTALKWEHVHTAFFEETDGALSKEGKNRIAQEFLRGMKRPAPILRGQVSLEGLENEGKAEKILEALKQDALYHRREGGLLPYEAGYPWKEEDTGRGKSREEKENYGNRRGESGEEKENSEDGRGKNGEGSENGEDKRYEGNGENGKNENGNCLELKQEEGEENTDGDASGTVLQRFYRQYGGFLSESYCVLHFGAEDTQDKKIHVFYASMKPFGFALASRSSDWPSSYQYREEELHRKVKEKHWIIGHFGWGDVYGPDGDAVPKIVALGESGTFYYYDVVRLLRGESLAALLAKVFDFSNIVTVETYEGNLSISRFNGELEYCYDRKAFLDSAYTVKKTGADLFTVFTKAEMMEEFAVFMDALLEGAAEEEGLSADELLEGSVNAPEPSVDDLLGSAMDAQKFFGVYFEFRHEGKGVCSMHVFSWEEDVWEEDELDEDEFEDEWEEGEDADGEFGKDTNDWGMSKNNVSWESTPVYKNMMQEKAPLIWKIWQQDGDFAVMLKDFTDVVFWYMDCGRYGKKLAECKRITVGFSMAYGGEPRVSVVYENAYQQLPGAD